MTSYEDMKPEGEYGCTCNGWFTDSQLMRASRGRIPLTDPEDTSDETVDCLFYTHDADEFHIEFFVAQCISTGEDGPLYDKVFTGSGPSGNLRELRHTNWGESGYIFYPDSALIARAFNVLGRWFDI